MGALGTSNKIFFAVHNKKEEVIGGLLKMEDHKHGGFVKAIGKGKGKGKEFGVSE